MTRINVSLQVGIKTGEVEIPIDTLPPGIWAQALHDYESPPAGKETAEYYRADLGYPVPRSLEDPKDRLSDAKGFPEMVPGDPRIGVKLTKNLQWFWYRLLVWSKTGVLLVEREETFEEQYKRFLREGRISRTMDEYLKNAWRGLTKSFTAFTNQKGTDNCIDYIREVTNGTSSLPILWENTTGGSLLRLESTRVYRQGYKILALRTSDFHLWKNWTPVDHPGYFSDATNETPFGYDGKPTLRGPWRVDRFHYLGGAPVWVPIISAAGYFYLRKNRIRILHEGETFPPRVTNP
jgi:hypothetical protein